MKDIGSRLERVGAQRKNTNDKHIEGQRENRMMRRVCIRLHADDGHAMHHKTRRDGGTASRRYIWERDSIHMPNKTQACGCDARDNLHGYMVQKYRGGDGEPDIDGLLHSRNTSR